MFARWPEHAAANRRGRDLAQLEDERADDVPLLGLGHRAEEQPRLAVVIGERLGPLTDLVAGVERRERRETRRGIFARRVGRQAVRLVRDLARVDVHAPHAVALEVAHRALRPVDRDLVEVRAAQPQQLRVGVGEQPPLQQRIVA